MRSWHGTAALLLGAAGCLLGLCASDAAADDGKAADPAEALAADPPTWTIGDSEIRLGGFGYGTAYMSHQNNGHDASTVSGQARANIRIQNVFDNGLVLGARAEALLFRDALSGDNYGNDTIEKAYLFAQTGFGRVELGEQDGAAYTMGLTGPSVDDQIGLDKPGQGFFRDPLTGANATRYLQQPGAVEASLNDAKINYISPRLFGLQIGASYTPETVKSPLPGLGNATGTPGTQSGLWEGAAAYSGYVSNVALGVSAGFAHGTLRDPAAGYSDLYDWALGVQAAYDAGPVKLSLGGDWRASNAAFFDAAIALRGQETHTAHLAAMAEMGPWRAGGEFSDIRAGAAAGFAGTHVQAWQAALGYKVNGNIQLTGGWQWYDFLNGAGPVFAGRPADFLDAGFLKLGYEL